MKMLWRKEQSSGVFIEELLFIDWKYENPELLNMFFCSLETAVMSIEQVCLCGIFEIWDTFIMRWVLGHNSLCIIDAIICWFSRTENCWKIILFVPVSVASAESYRKSALPKSDNHYKVNFVPDSMEVIGGKYVIGMMRIILRLSSI